MRSKKQKRRYDVYVLTAGDAKASVAGGHIISVVASNIDNARRQAKRKVKAYGGEIYSVELP